MRRFHSYGPVNACCHFSVPRTVLADDYCLNSLIGNDIEGGHYFTLWAPRQTGKTWLMQEVQRRIQLIYPEQFIVGMMSMQGLSFITDKPVIEFLKKIPSCFWILFRWILSLQKLMKNGHIFFIEQKGYFKNR